MARGPRPAGRPRHVPQRTCVACRQGKPKREMLRVVRTVDGAVELDNTGKKSGRGAYLCNDPDCWRSALEGRRGILAHALRLESISKTDLEALAAHAAKLKKADLDQAVGASLAPLAVS